MNKNKPFLALYATSTGVAIDFVGKLMLAEIIALITLPFINFKRLFANYRVLRFILGGLLLLLISQMISDFVNNSSPSDYLRGWALIVFSMVSTVFLVNYLSKSPNNIIYYLFPLFMVYMFFGDSLLDLSEVDTNYFKVRFVGFLNPAIMMISYYLYKLNMKLTTSLMLLSYALVCFVFDARSNGLIFTVSTLLLYIKTLRIKIKGTKLIFLGLIVTITLYLGYIFYANQVVYHGFGGMNSQNQLAKVENLYNPFELLIYGRTDFFVLAQAVADKPIWGHGSWSKDTDGRYAILTAILSESSQAYDVGYIPAHSVFLGTWAYAGIIGFVATLYVFITLFSMSLTLYKTDMYSNIIPIVIILSVDMLWAFFFSPIAVLRTYFPIFAAIIIVEFEQFKSRPQNHFFYTHQQYIAN